uniref:Uncharacterized protein n=1 Tax=Oryza nivara TaxID=4536 RepID=A0A0E0G6W7_ORYNI
MALATFVFSVAGDGDEGDGALSLVGSGASSALDTSRPRVEHAQSSVGSDSLRSLSLSLFSCRLREVNKCKDKPVRLS